MQWERPASDRSDLLVVPTSPDLRAERSDRTAWKPSAVTIPRGDEVPEAFFHLDGESPCDRADFGMEESASGLRASSTSREP